MKKRSLWLITGLMTVALLGVFVMQLYYIRQAYNLNSQLFEQDVNQALNAVVTKVQKRNAALHISRKDRQMELERKAEVQDQAKQLVEYKDRFKEEAQKRVLERQRLIVADLNQTDLEIRKSYANPILISEDEFRAASDLGNPNKSPVHVDVNVGLDAFGNVVAGQIKSTFVQERPKLFNVAQTKLPDSIHYLAVDPGTGKNVLISVRTVSAELERKFILEDNLAKRKYDEGLKRLMSDTIPMKPGADILLQDVAKEMRDANVPLSKMIAKDVLDTLIKKELLNRNITLKYDFWVGLAQKDSLVYRKAANTTGELLPKNTYKATLFNSVIRDPGMLYLYFPNKNSLIFANLSVTMASSAGLLLVLIFIFAYTIYTILRQKKISEMKTDFINNMTHEFKTPVATIMIASEALKDPEVVADKSRISRLAGIIYDENVRLGNHIERVLSIARLEKKELKLEHKEVNIHDLITAVVDSMNLQLQKKNARVTLNLEALQPVILGDELHLSNVFYNLVDNANKYSSENPKITITTRNTDKALHIEIADEGIGMTKEHSKRIFDQFYRVPTGNLHDVKGFGLGLNYVQDIIEQMNGSIKVQSEKDKGTTFEINLPLNHNHSK
ncbi:two-component system phosphate regulon sensor histidine kinase PhoR [Pedobacter sp. AK017]|uniref:sensor histidine kinase n=1 Tax=Pedobacter sp. AK017 TaxID=2723073 RepID=UPI00160AD3E5|nr:HAMP domain-containing sensor histidine kinase [Pedobacter sp. AK017]MBB5440114.1 two-component system phosphate regulon sensor histidine kinase PhoR [Pedobacter sp. AK017]